MKIKNMLGIIFVIFGIFVKFQLSMTIKEVDYGKFEYYIPKHQRAANEEIKNQGHILEVTLSNNSYKAILIPIDTLSYALPYTENINQYYNKPENIPSNPDIFNVLGIYPFIYQNKKFKESDLATDPFYEMEQLEEKANISKIRLDKIANWKKLQKINTELSATYNWYIVNNIITIPPRKLFKFKIHFNPFLKMLHSLSYGEYYFQLSKEIPYTATFKIILNKNLYQFLTKEDKEKYPDLFSGVVSSNTMIFQQP